MVDLEWLFHFHKDKEYKRRMQIQNYMILLGNQYMVHLLLRIDQDYTRYMHHWLKWLHTHQGIPNKSKSQIKNKCFLSKDSKWNPGLNIFQLGNHYKPFEWNQLLYHRGRVGK